MESVRVKTQLPGVADYLRAVWDLGKSSIRPALPALAFLYFYRVGVGAYTAVASRTSVLEGATAADLVPRLAVALSLLPVFLLIYTPMIPLQDSLLQGRPMTFLASARRMTEQGWALTLSGIIQGFALAAPFLVICVAAVLLAPMSQGTPLDPSRLFLVAAVALLGLFGVFVVALLLMFATPALLLDGEGPLQSIGTSMRLVLGHLGGILGRVLAFFFLTFVLLVMLTMPTQILSQVSSISGGPTMAIKIAAVIWTSALATALFPFGVASLIVLYRALVPSRGVAPGAPVPLDEEFQPTAARVPFE